MQIAPDIRREAMRIAKRMVIDALRAQGIKISHIRASDILKACRVLIVHPNCSAEVMQQAWDICKMRWEAQRV